MRVPKESPDEKSLRGQGWENLNAGVRSQPYKITMSRRLLLWHVEHLPRMKNESADRSRRPRELLFAANFVRFGLQLLNCSLSLSGG